MSETEPKKTALHDWHVARGGKIVPFAGYALPVTYPLGLMGEHAACREAAALFDVSHMGQVRVSGPQAVAFLEKLTPMDVANLKIGTQTYGFLLNDTGGVRDDLMCARFGDDRFELVINAACKDTDLKHMRAVAQDFDVELTVHDRSLVALQGPRAVEAIASTPVAAAAQITFMEVAEFDGGFAASRSGYTGEDGFEIAVPHDQVETFVESLCAHDFVEPAGLGARDSLRLEAGLCLYGQELNADLTPLDASLSWALPKTRSGYEGAQAIADQRENGIAKARIALLPEGRAPLRTGAPILSADGQAIGHVTSGVFSPTLGRPIAMASIKRAHLKDPSFIGELRGKQVSCEKTKLPFVKKSYAK